MPPKEHRFANVALYADFTAENKRKATAKAKPKSLPKAKAPENTASRFAHLHGLVKQAPAEPKPAAPLKTPEAEAKTTAAFIIKSSRKGLR